MYMVIRYTQHKTLCKIGSWKIRKPYSCLNMVFRLCIFLWSSLTINRWNRTRSLSISGWHFGIIQEKLKQTSVPLINSCKNLLAPLLKNKNSYSNIRKQACKLSDTHEEASVNLNVYFKISYTYKIWIYSVQPLNFETVTLNIHYIHSLVMMALSHPLSKIIEF